MSCGLPNHVLVDLAGMRMASIAAGVSLAHVCDRGFRVRRLDFERSNERVLGFDRHLIRLVPDLDADRIPQGIMAASVMRLKAGSGTRAP
jgi:hypothetical protein